MEPRIVKRIFASYKNDNLNLLLRKGVYAYEYTLSLDRLREAQLPPKEAFQSQLSHSDMSDEDYEHAHNVWREFEIKMLGEYRDLYLKTDVVLLAELFEDFRCTCLQDDDLDPAQYFTLPSLSRDSMLKKTGIELELLTDINSLLLIERGMHRGISQCCNQYAEANNTYMNENYNPR